MEEGGKKRRSGVDEKRGSRVGSGGREKRSKEKEDEGRIRRIGGGRK